MVIEKIGRKGLVTGRVSIQSRGKQNGRSYGHGKEGGYYSCNNSSKMVSSCRAKNFIRKETLEGMIFDALRSYLTDEGAMRDIYRKLRRIEQKQEKDGSRPGYENELKETESAISRIAEAIAESGYSQALLVKLAELENKKLELARSLALESKNYGVKIKETEEEFVRYWREMWGKASKAEGREKQLFFRSMLERVEAVKEGDRIRGKLILSDGRELRFGG